MVTLHVGTYADRGGPGLVPVKIGREGPIVVRSAFSDAANASFGAYSPRHDLHYMVDEQDRGAVNVLRLEAGSWRKLGRVDANGAAPCYLALDPAEERLAVANYESGNAALFALDDGGLPQAPSLFQSHGSGAVADRQEGPHAHCVRFSPDGGSLYLVDLGADRVWRIEVNGSVFGDPATAWQAPPGNGPRHLLLHPGAPLAVLLSELASELSVLAMTDGRLIRRSVRSTVPAGFAGENLGGHLALNAAGDRVYASNRGRDTIAVFALDAATGELALLQHVSSGGAHPRHFLLIEEERLLVAAHENDGRIELFEIAADGKLVALNRGVIVPGACFLVHAKESGSSA